MCFVYGKKSYMMQLYMSLMTNLDEGSARRTDLFLTTRNTNKPAAADEFSRPRCHRDRPLTSSLQRNLGYACVSSSQTDSDCCAV